jgi:hypothetical protein
MDKIVEVEYDGAYPNTCSGTLIIKVGGEEIFVDKYACTSSGSVWMDKDSEMHVESGQLTWTSDSQKKFSNWFDEHYQEKGWKPSFLVSIQKAVRSALAEHHVCCGGCT